MSLQVRTVIRGTAFAAATPALAHPCELDLVISVDRPRRVSRTVEASVHGRAEIPPLVHGAEVRGTLRLNWLLRPSATFELDIPSLPSATAPGGSLTAHWRPDLLHPLASWTRMWARIDDRSGVAIAWMQLHFDARRDLATLLASLDRQTATIRPSETS